MQFLKDKTFLVCATILIIVGVVALTALTFAGHKYNLRAVFAQVIPISTALVTLAGLFHTQKQQTVALQSGQDDIQAKTDVVIGKADQAAVAAVTATSTVQNSMNGALDARIQLAVVQAVNAWSAGLVPAEPPNTSLPIGQLAVPPGGVPFSAK